ncbi:class I SAM-dependent methyltransferase [Streptomyces sp. NPDC048279]|jgi:SAM-dependent methyltransferase|uniref:class I SAM-dependent methyltransferase n=1 Tax=Streptomyces sp. NPDC048279 TaxID=3154714 RepID=UPI0034160D50
MSVSPHHPGAAAPHQPDNHNLYAGPPPWDIGRPQPTFQALADAGAVHGRVLDVGCGTGEHALMAARLGLDATGIDLAPRALELAAKKAEERGLTARFLRHDARLLADLGETFDVLLASLVLHGFRGQDREAFVKSLHAAVRPGGRCFLLCFRDEPLPTSGSTHRVAPQEVRTAFADGWRIDTIDAATIDSALPVRPEGIRGWRAALTRI